MIATSKQRDMELCVAIQDVATALEREVEEAGADCPHAHFRGQVAAPLMASAMMALAGCGGSTSFDESRAGVSMNLCESAENKALDSIFDDDDPDADTTITDGQVADTTAPESCDGWVDTICLEPPAPLDPAIIERVAFESQLMQPCGEYGYLKATVDVNDTARGKLVELIGATGMVDPSEPVFQCVADLLTNYDLSCFRGETVVFEDPGPMD